MFYGYSLFGKTSFFVCFFSFFVLFSNMGCMYLCRFQTAMQEMALMLYSSFEYLNTYSFNCFSQILKRTTNCAGFIGSWIRHITIHIAIIFITFYQKNKINTNFLKSSISQFIWRSFKKKKNYLFSKIFKI